MGLVRTKFSVWIGQSIWHLELKRLHAHKGFRFVGECDFKLREGV
jgi:hypothetical protein